MLNERIEIWCAANGKNRAALAAMLGTSANAISKWAARRSVPRVETNKRLAELLGLDPVQLREWFKSRP